MEGKHTYFRHSLHEQGMGQSRDSLVCAMFHLVLPVIARGTHSCSGRGRLDAKSPAQQCQMSNGTALQAASALRLSNAMLKS